MLRPRARTSRELSELAARVNWYLPDSRVPIAVVQRSGIEVAPEHAPWMDPSLVRAPGWLHAVPEGSSHDVIHRIDSRQAARVIRRGRSTVLADPTFYSVADLGWVWLRWHFATMPWQSTAPALERLFALGGAGASSFVLATGPSAQLVDPAAVTADVRITCNSAVRDLDLLRTLRPNVICFGDPAFHYGPSRYAAAFRRDLLRAVDETDAVLVTLDLFAGVLLAHHPELAERLVILQVLKSRPAWTWPSRDRMTVRMTGNILTNAMVPVAFSLSDTIAIAGCDGRSPDESYFWRHNARTQYDDTLMGTVFAAHPAFFRDQHYAVYYEEHCQQLEALLRAGEGAGKEVTGVTPSFIPAMRSRGASAPA